MKQKRKKLLFTLFFTNFFAIPFLVSCVEVNGETKVENQATKIENSLNKKTYDFGLATDPLNNLNYIKYKSVFVVLPSLVDSFLKTGPNAELRPIIKPNSFHLTIVDTNDVVNDKGELSSNFDDLIKKRQLYESQNGYGKVTSNFYTLQDFGIIGGLGRPTDNSNSRETSTIYAFRNPKNPSNYMGVTGLLNKKINQWSNGDFINSQDLRDSLEYILDLNTGSQQLDIIRKTNIRGIERFIDAQKEYSKKFNQAYQNPWGRRKYVQLENGEWIQNPDEVVWESQNEGDEKWVEEIKKTALSFGFYTGQLFLDYSNEDIEKNLEYNPDFKLDADVQDFEFRDKNGNSYKRKIIRNVYVNPYQTYQIVDKKIVPSIKSFSYDENSYSIIFDENKTVGLGFLLERVLQALYPINRKFIETTVGGIDQYGTDITKFLTSGPFNVKDKNDIVLGPQGFIRLTKNNDYFDAENTLSSSILIYFSTDKNINATLLEDGYISFTKIPAEKITSYWSDVNKRKYLKKQQGFGTIALGYNLDYETNADSYIFDEDLRNAIYYAVNREDMLRVAGWEFSLPSSTWTALGQNWSFDGRNLETFLTDLTSKLPDGTELPILKYDNIVHSAKKFDFEKTSREDQSFLPKTAQFYLKRFKRKHPNLSKVTLRFINNSTDEQKKIGFYLKNAFKKLFGDYLDLEIKSLPENTYASWIEEGKYDIIYQNYDRLGGQSAESYVTTFFQTDEIDSLILKKIGFKTNPVGSYTYADYLSELVLQAKKTTAQEMLQEFIDDVQEAINSNEEILNEFKQIAEEQKQKDFAISKFISFLNDKNIDTLYQTLQPKAKPILTKKFIKIIVEYLLTIKPNIKVSRIRKAVNEYIANTFTIDEINDLTISTAKRLGIQQSLSKSVKVHFWKKFIELAYIKENESIIDYTDRLNTFFSGNFTNVESKQGWSEHNIFVFIGELEKIIRDAAFVVPLMEVDTNWDLRRVGGVDSLFTFSLQFAYDYENPPRPGLPKKGV